MRLTIIIPHYKVGKATAYAVSQFLKYKGRHDIRLIIGDNNPGDGSIKYLEPFKKDITIVNYPKGKLQSHGILIDYVLSRGHVDTPYFLTAESDSFPTQKDFLDYYEELAKEGYDGAGSLLQLSGGQYMHPCGALYKRSVWQEAEDYCKQLPYGYFPNIAMNDGFATHLMVHNTVLDDFCKNPAQHITLAESHKAYTEEQLRKALNDYSPVVCPFHNGMGKYEEAYATYGKRSVGSEPAGIVIAPDRHLIPRMGYEPGQWFCYYLLATGRRLHYIPTDTKWMAGRENQQQEYTRMENGFTHLWGISSYDSCTIKEISDITKFKKNQMEVLYNSLPENQKI